MSNRESLPQSLLGSRKDSVLIKKPGNSTETGNQESRDFSGSQPDDDPPSTPQALSGLRREREELPIQGLPTAGASESTQEGRRPGSKDCRESFSHMKVVRVKRVNRQIDSPVTRSSSSAGGPQEQLRHPRRPQSFPGTIVEEDGRMGLDVHNGKAQRPSSNFGQSGEEEVVTWEEVSPSKGYGFFLFPSASAFSWPETSLPRPGFNPCASGCGSLHSFDVRRLPLR